MKFTDAQILMLPARCLYDRRARHEYYRKLYQRLTLALFIVWLMIPDVVDGEVIEEG